MLMAETLEQRLKEENISCFLLDKRDSSYPGILGYVEVYVDKQDADAAKGVIEAWDEQSEEA